MKSMVNGYSWEQARRTTEFILHDFDTWQAQNQAEIIEYAEGCLLDNMICACKRGTAFIFEEYQNEWTSRYHVYFIPYKEQESNGDYNRLWDRFTALQEQAMGE